MEKMIKLLVNIIQLYVVFKVSYNVLKLILCVKFKRYNTMSKGFKTKSIKRSISYKINKLFSREIRYFLDNLLFKQEERLAIKRKQALIRRSNVEIDTASTDNIVHVDFIKKHKKA